MKKALLVIDAQNDYLENGLYPLWNTKTTLENIKKRVQLAQDNGELIIFIQHISKELFFIEDSFGAQIIDDFKQIAEKSIIIQKRFPSSFDQTNLLDTLESNKITDIDICGMMTQNCVLFTAIDQKAKIFNPKIVPEACTSVSQIIHLAGLIGLSRMGFIQGNPF